MSDTDTKNRTKPRITTQRPKMHKVLLVNDDYTPRDFVVEVLKAVFSINADAAYSKMMVAHQKGVCVIAVYTREVAETKATEAVDLAQQAGFPLMFTTEPEE